MVESENFVVVILESNVVMDSKDWWIDSRAIRHICGDRNSFVNFQKIESGEKLYMGNVFSSMVEDKGDVVLNLTLGKKLTLMDVLFVPKIRKNLVSTSLLSKKGFKLVFDSDKLVLTKGGAFIGKGYMSEGLFKINVFNDNVIASTINKSFMSSTYIVESCELWHSRLGHVNYHSMYKMANLGLLPKFDINETQKCEICVESKFARKPFKSIERSSELLELVHSDLCDLKMTPTRGGRKYFITFIDDYSRFCYVYLLHSKDETIDVFKTYKNEVLSEFCALHGIVHQTTTPFTPL